MTKEEQFRQKIKNYVLSLFEGREETPTKEEKEWLENCLYLFAEPREKRIAELEAQIEKMKCDVLSLVKDGMNDDIDQNIIERLAEKWEIKENE